ncbi:MAG: hypothetical protein ACFB9M_05605 [Myxococcota bacterium]
MTLANEWRLDRGAVDANAFSGRLGPYRIGRSVRTTASGEVVLALHDQDPRIVELELLDPIRVQEQDRPVLEQVNHMLGVDHRHVAQILGAGIVDNVIYVARIHRLGRTLAQTMVGELGQKELGPAIAYAVADALQFLAEAGPRPGACALGGFDSRDVMLGFDGSITLVGAGLQALRDAQAPLQADRSSLVHFILELDRWLGTEIAPMVPANGAPGALAVALRKTHRDACGQGRASLGAFLRSAFADSLREERAFFGMSTLH